MSLLTICREKGSEEKDENNSKIIPESIEYIEPDDIKLDIVIPLDISDISDLTSHSREAHAEENSFECMVLEYQKTGDEELLNEIIEKSHHSVKKLAEKFSFIQRDSTLDFIQEGFIGVIEAARRYDADKGAKFLTYANYWIKKMMIDYMNMVGAGIRVPQNIRNGINTVRRIEQNVTEELGRTPTSQELAERFIKISAEKSGEQPDYSKQNISDTENYINEIRKYSKSVLSLNKCMGDDDCAEVLDLIPDSHAKSPEKDLDEEILNNEINKIIDDRLTVNEAYVLRSKYGIRSQSTGNDGIPRTREEIAKKMSISKDRVRQLEKAAKKNLRSTQPR